MTRIRRALVALVTGLVAAAGVAAVPAPAAVAAPVPAAATCGGVWVMVEGYGVRCATSHATGKAALQSAGFSLQEQSPGFLCRINGAPSVCDVLPSAFWSYWQAEKRADGTYGPWVFSNFGYTQTHPKAGDAEGWTFGAGTETSERPPRPPAAPRPADPKPTNPKPADPKPADPKPTVPPAPQPDPKAPTAPRAPAPKPANPKPGDPGPAPESRQPSTGRPGATPGRAGTQPGTGAPASGASRPGDPVVTSEPASPAETAPASPDSPASPETAATPDTPQEAAPTASAQPVDPGSGSPVGLLVTLGALVIGGGGLGAWYLLRRGS